MAPRLPNNPNKADNQQDILDQFIDDDEDEDQLSDGSNDEEDFDGDTDDGTSNDDDTTEPVQNKKEEPEDDKIPAMKQDKNGNLLNKDGTIAVRGGKDRGVWDKLKTKLDKSEQEKTNLATQLGDIAARSRELMEKYKALRDEREYGAILGLEKTEQKEALELFAKFKLDPKGALKSVLTKLHLAGQDLSDIGVSAPLDPAEVAKHVLALQEKNKPTTAPVAKEQDGDPNKEANDFMNRFPHLKARSPENDQMIDAIVRGKERFPHLSFDEIYVRIREHLARNGGKPIKKENTQPQDRRQDRPHGNNNHQRRESNKRGLDTSARSPNMSFNDIGKELLRDLQELEEN